MIAVVPVLGMLAVLPGSSSFRPCMHAVGRITGKPSIMYLGKEHGQSGNNAGPLDGLDCPISAEVGHWLTYRQAQTVGGHVRMGEKGLPVVYWKFGTREVEDGEEVTEKPSVLCRQYTVFNIDQCEGLRLQPTPVKETPIEPIEACERVVGNWQQKPTITYGDCASYSKTLDLVRMPERDSFESAEKYHSTLFHELVHSTGHPTRLNRSTLTDFERWGDATYSKEELCAEMGAAFLAGYCGISNRTLSNSAAYLANWLQVLRNDSRMIVIAGSQAQRATDLILGVSPAITA